jgi:hypothetical protein
MPPAFLCAIASAGRLLAEDHRNVRAVGHPTHHPRGRIVVGVFEYQNGAERHLASC